MLVKEYIYNERPQRIVFLVPTNSLADELVEDFNTIFNKLGYTIFDTTKKESTIKEMSIFIGTQEKYYQIYKKYDQGIDLFVVDEAYKLSDKLNGSREVILNRTLIDSLHFATKVILLLPLVYEINGLDDLNFKILKSDFAPVAKNFIGVKDLENTLLNKINNSNESNLIYFNGPNDAEKFFLSNVNNISGRINLSTEWISRVEQDFHPEWIPVKALRSGVGIHYGPMPKFIQKKVIDLFNNSEIKSILATSSVIEGVNTPAKNVFITTSRDILGGKNIIKFKNLIGRAGRLGIHKVGNVFFKEAHQNQFNLANIPYENIKLNFIINDKEQIIEINREGELKYDSILIDHEEDSYKKNSKEYVGASNYETVPFEKISHLLNNYGFTIKQFKDLIEYIGDTKINLFGILGKLKSSDSNINSINIILNNQYETISDIAYQLKKNLQFSTIEIPKLVSIIIKMIYSVIPHKIIPSLEFIIELNRLYKEHNIRNLIADNIIQEAHLKKTLFYNKFLGVSGNTADDSRIIMSKLFEYGIPYFRVKDHLGEISEKIPSNFSIYDIKKVIFENDDLIDLRVYFD